VKFKIHIIDIQSSTNSTKG